MNLKLKDRIEAEGPYSVRVSRLTWIYGERKLGYSPRKSSWVTAESAMRKLEVSRG